MARLRRVLAICLVVAGLATAGARAFAEEKGAAKKDSKTGAKAGSAPEKGAKADATKDAKREVTASADKDPKKEAKADAIKDAKEEKPASKVDAKAEAKTEAKTDAKTDAKTETKTETKTGAKGEAKAEAKSDAKGEAQGEAKFDAKSDSKGTAKSNSKKGAKTAERAGTSRTSGAKSGDSGAGTIGEEPVAGPIPPPLKLSGLREEMSHPPVRHDEHPATKAEREKLEQLAAAINKARDGLRQETARLEAMLAARDAAPPPVSSAGTPSGGDNGEPPKKVPSPLDTLAKAIRGMKPEQAAPILSRVDRKLAADVLLRMPGADAGKVMGVCKPEVAAELAAEIASRTPRAELRR